MQWQCEDYVDYLQYYGSVSVSDIKVRFSAILAVRPYLRSADIVRCSASIARRSALVTRLTGRLPHARHMFNRANIIRLQRGHRQSLGL